MKKLTIDFVREEFRKRGYELLEDEYINAQTKMKYKCPYHLDKELSITYSNLKQDYGCPYCASVSKHNYNFVKSEFEKRDYELLDTKYVNAHTKMKYKCKYHSSEVLSISYGSLKQGSGCPICANRKILIGFNDMWTTNPEQASLLLDSDDGYKYTQCSSAKVSWKCNNCNNIINNKRISDINRRGLSCEKCADGISYPQKLVANILNELEISFKTEQYFDWCIFELNERDYKGRYDFVFEYDHKKYIIETDGLLGHGNNAYNKNKITIKNEIYIDKMKDKLAKENGYEMIRIDCRKSDLNYIKNNVLNSRLNNIFDFCGMDWNMCHKNSLKSKIIEACNLWSNGITNTTEIGRILCVERHAALRYLKHGKEIGLCNYCPNQSQINNGKKLSECVVRKKITCLTTSEVFNSISEAALRYGIKSNGHISSCCLMKRKSAGKHPETGEKLVWQYYNPLIHTPENGYSYV